MTRQKWLPLALLGGAVLVLAAALLALRGGQADVEPEAGAIALCPLEAAAVDGIEYTLEGDTIALKKDAQGTWTLTDDPALPLDQDTVQTMATDMAALQAAGTLDAEGDAAEMGLDAPEPLTLTAGADSVTLEIGAVNVMTGSYYLRKAGENTVYVVDSTAISGLRHSRRGLYAAQKPAGWAAEDLTTFTVQNSAGETLQFLNGSDGWKLTDAPDLALDQDTVGRMANTICEMETAWSITAPQADSAYGLDAPDVTVTAANAAGDTLTLRFGGETEDGSGCYLAASTAPNVVYEVLAQHRDAFAVTRETLAAATPETAETP